MKRITALVLAAGMMLALLYAFRNAVDFGIDSDRLVDVVAIGTVMAIVCARIYYVAMAPFEYQSLWDMIDIRKGGKMFCNTKGVTYFTGIAKQTIYNDRNTFIVPNSVNKVTDPTTGAVSYVENTTPLTYENIQTYWADQYDRDGSDLISKDYVKLRNVVITWQLPKKWLAKTPFTDISVSVFGRNLITWTPDDNTFVDPESSTLGNDLEGQFGEFTVNPSTRTYGFNLNLKF